MFYFSKVPKQVLGRGKNRWLGRGTENIFFMDGPKFVSFFVCIAYIHICVCSAQSKNLYNSRIVLRKVGILTLMRNVGNSYLAQYNSWIAPAQSENRDKVGIY